MSAIDLSIVVGTKDRPESYGRLIGSIERTTEGINFEVVVGDASEGERYTEDTSNIHALREDPPLGTLRGYNECFRHCAGEWVAWLNDDVECCSGWAKAAIDFMEGSSKVGLGAIYFSDLRPDGTYGPFQVYDFPGRRVALGGTIGMVEYPGIPHPCFGVISRRLGNEVGWFDEDMGCKAYGCDTSLQLRVVDAGKAVCRIPGCKVIHHRALVEGQQGREQDQARFLEKWSPRFMELLAKHRRHARLVGPQVIE